MITVILQNDYGDKIRGRMQTDLLAFGIDYNDKTADYSDAVSHPSMVQSGK